MLSEADVLNTLSSRDVTYDWDIVLAYHRDEINTIFEQQYIEKIRDNINFEEINDRRGNFIFEHLVLGPPLISFENSTTEDSRATATIEFISGSVIELNDMGQVVRLERVEAGLGYNMILDIQLKSGEGVIGSLGEVLVNFREGSLRILNIVNTPHIEIFEYFRNWLLTQNVTYQLGELDLNEYNELTPYKFRIRTQAAPGIKSLNSFNYGSGAVLLFIATKHNPNGGAMPAGNYPWIIPDGYSHSFIVNKNLIMNTYIKPTMDKLLDVGQWELNENSNGIRYLKASYDARINMGIIKERNNSMEVWTGVPSTQLNIKKYSSFFIPLSGATLIPNMYYLDLNFANSFSAAFVGQGPTNIFPFGLGFNVSFLSIGSGRYDFEKQIENDRVQINTSNISYIITAAGAPNILYSSYNSFVQSNICPLIQDYVWHKLTLNQFPPIDLSFINHMLLPQRYVSTIKKIAMPSDLIGFGNIAPNATMLIIEPLRPTIAVGNKIQFHKNNTQNILWSISPNDIGSIDQNGLYTAPTSLPIGIKIIIVTAKNDLGQIASAALTLLPSSVAITPLFITIKEGNTDSVQLVTRKYPESTSITWSISSESEVYGSITDNGFYTPPLDRPFQIGYTFVVVTATASDKGQDCMYICLVSKDTKAEFKIEPAYILGAEPGKSITLRANSTLDFNPNTWSQFPVNGILDVTSGYDGGYSVNYSPLKTNINRGLIFIRTMHNDKPHRSGYSVIEVIAK